MKRARRLLERLRKLDRLNVAYYGGAAAVAFGFGLIYLPAGFIVGGAIAMAMAFLVANAGGDE